MENNDLLDALRQERNHMLDQFRYAANRVLPRIVALIEQGRIRNEDESIALAAKRYGVADDVVPILLRMLRQARANGS